MNLPVPGVMVKPTVGFNPTLLVGVKVHPDNPFRFDFIVDTGEDKLQGEELKAESTKLIKYFLASLTVPEDELWVNLSPYEKDRIIPEKFGITEMGKDLLAQDYLLKQLTASLIYPEDELGKSFWAKIYQKAYDLYGTTNIPINTFNKVWIIPDNAVVYENKDVAFVVESHLKVMLEGDYLALQNNLHKEEIGTDKLEDKDVRQLSDMSSQIVKDVILPAIEKEVNDGKNFAQLRQIYSGLILAAWYKKRLKESILAKVYADKNKVAGVDVEDKEIKDKIYEQYVEAFKQGVYDYIKDDDDPFMGKTLRRRYVSGGFTTDGLISTDKHLKIIDEAQIATSPPLRQKIFDGFRKILNPIMIVGAALLLPNSASAQDRPQQPAVVTQSNLGQTNQNTSVPTNPNLVFSALAKEYELLVSKPNYNHEDEKGRELLMSIGRTKSIEAINFLSTQSKKPLALHSNQRGFIIDALMETQRIEALPVLIKIVKGDPFEIIEQYVFRTINVNTGREEVFERDGETRYGAGYKKILNFKPPSESLNTLVANFQRALQGEDYYAANIYLSVMGNIHTPAGAEAIDVIIRKITFAPTQMVTTRLGRVDGHYHQKIALMKFGFEALGKNGTPEALSILLTRLNESSQDGSIYQRRAQIMTSIATYAQLTGDLKAFSALESVLNTNKYDDRVQIFDLLGNINGPYAYSAVQLLDKHYQLLIEKLKNLSEKEKEEARVYLQEGITRGDSTWSAMSERQTITNSLMRLANNGVKEAYQVLPKIVLNADKRTVANILILLRHDGESYESIPLLELIYNNTAYLDLKEMIVDILGGIKHPSSTQLLIKIINDGDYYLHTGALKSLGYTQQPEAREFLLIHYNKDAREQDDKIACIDGLAVTGLKEAKSDLLNIYHGSQNRGVRLAVVSNLAEHFRDDKLGDFMVDLYEEDIKESQLSLREQWNKYSLKDFLTGLYENEHADIRGAILQYVVKFNATPEKTKNFENYLTKETSIENAQMIIPYINSSSLLLEIIDNPGNFAFLKKVSSEERAKIIGITWGRIMHLVSTNYFKSPEVNNRLLARFSQDVHAIQERSILGEVLGKVSETLNENSITNNKKEAFSVYMERMMDVFEEHYTQDGRRVERLRPIRNRAVPLEITQKIEPKGPGAVVNVIEPLSEIIAVLIS